MSLLSGMGAFIQSFLHPLSGYLLSISYKPDKYMAQSLRANDHSPIVCSAPALHCTVCPVHTLPCESGYELEMAALDFLLCSWGLKKINGHFP